MATSQTIGANSGSGFPSTLTTINESTPLDGFTVDFTRIGDSIKIRIDGQDLFTGGYAGQENSIHLSNRLGPPNIQFTDGTTFGDPGIPDFATLADGTVPILRVYVKPSTNEVLFFGKKSQTGNWEEMELTGNLSVDPTTLPNQWQTFQIQQIQVGYENVPSGFRGYEAVFTDLDILPCFAADTMIGVPDGEVKVSDLRAGDFVCSVDGTLKKVLWVGSSKVDKRGLQSCPSLYPVRIKAGALGGNLPKSDLLVSRQHRMLVRSSISGRIFGEQEVLVAANKLVGVEGIEVAEDVESVEYFHILFDAHEVIYANGAPSESLFTGPQALAALRPDQLAEIQRLFPEICDPEYLGIPARYVPKEGKQVRKLVERHVQNAQPLVS